MDYGLNRTRRFEVRVSPEEEEILNDMAKANGITVSDYLRWMGMWEATKKRHPLALKILGEKISAEARSIRERFYENVAQTIFGKVKRV